MAHMSLPPPTRYTQIPCACCLCTFTVTVKRSMTHLHIDETVFFFFWIRQNILDFQFVIYFNGLLGQSKEMSRIRKNQIRILNQHSADSQVGERKQVFELDKIQLTKMRQFSFILNTIFNISCLFLVFKDFSKQYYVLLYYCKFQRYGSGQLVDMNRCANEWIQCNLKDERKSKCPTKITILFCD